MENQEIDLHLYGQLHFDDDAKAIWWRKDSVQQMVLEKKWTSIYKICASIHTLYLKN